MKIRVFDSKLSKVYVIWNNILCFRHVKFTRFFESVAVWSKSTPNSMTIPCHFPRFYSFFMLEHDMDFG